MRRYRGNCAVLFGLICRYTWVVGLVEAILSNWREGTCVRVRTPAVLAKWEEHLWVPLLARHFRSQEETGRPIESCSLSGDYNEIHESSMPVFEDELVVKTSTRNHPPEIQGLRNSKFEQKRHVKMLSINFHYQSSFQNNKLQVSTKLNKLCLFPAYKSNPTTISPTSLTFILPNAFLTSLPTLLIHSLSSSDIEVASGNTTGLGACSVFTRV
jgi:hypothetical protein